jgi:hypothetical protein
MIHLRIPSALAEIQTEHLQDTSLKCYHYVNPFGMTCSLSERTNDNKEPVTSIFRAEEPLFALIP